MDYKTLELQKESTVYTIIFNRPEVHNALNEEMILEMLLLLRNIQKESFRILILKGKGKSFCSGADLNYMKKMKQYSLDENKKDALNLANLMYELYHFPKITICIGHGAIFGGGIGILACCDFSFCEESTQFSFSEVKLGLIPAVISPYIIRKIGFSKAKELFLSGSIFDSSYAEKIGLISKSLKKEEMDEYLKTFLKEMLKKPPQAIKEIKSLIELNTKHDLERLKEITSEYIANIRVSEEAQEGISAFLEKRTPKWILEDEN